MFLALLPPLPRRHSRRVGLTWRNRPGRLRTSRLVVPFPPGGLIDVMARAIGDKIAPVVGRPVIVENRPAPAA